MRIDKRSLRFRTGAFIVAIICAFVFLFWGEYAVAAKKKTGAIKKAVPAKAHPQKRVKQRVIDPAEQNIITTTKPPEIIKEAMQADDLSYICIEAQTGLVIAEHNADVPRPPASMIKMMQFLMVSEGLRSGKWTIDTPVTVTQNSENMGGTQVYLKAGEQFTLGQLMSAVAVASANDAAMAVAEGLFGSKEAYLAAINQRAKELSMDSSTFFSVHGLPPSPGQPSDQTTARDMARAAQFCVLDPQIMKWAGTKELEFRGNMKKFNTNKLLWNMEGCDGLKTGFTREAGFCLTATAVRNGIRLIGVVMGADAKRDRFIMTRELLEDGYGQVTKRRIVAKGEAVGSPINVANCEKPQMQLRAADELWVIVKNSDIDSLKVTPECPPVVSPPVSKGAPVGKLCVQLAGKELGSVPLTAPEDLQEASWRWKLMRTLTPWR